MRDDCTVTPAKGGPPVTSQRRDPVDVELRISGSDADRAAVLAALRLVLDVDEPGRPRRNRRDPGSQVYLRVRAVRPALVSVDQEENRLAR
jgi:hypothetical protein